MDDPTVREMATVVIDANEYLDEFVKALPLERVPAAALAVTELRKRLQKLEKTLEERWAAESGQGWQDPEGRLYTFTGAQKWKELGAPLALQMALRRVKNPPIRLQHLLNRAVRTKHEMDHAVLNQLAGYEPYAEVIRLYRERDYGPPHFEEL